MSAQLPTTTRDVRRRQKIVITLVATKKLDHLGTVGIIPPIRHSICVFEALDIDCRDYLVTRHSILEKREASTIPLD